MIASFIRQIARLYRRNAARIVVLSLCTFLFTAFYAGAFAAENDVVVNKESGIVYREGLGSFKKGDYDAALRLFQESGKLDARNTAAFFAQALALDKLKRFDEAATVLDSLIVRDKTDKKARMLHALVLERAGKLPEAKKSYEKAIELMPEDYRQHYGRARTAASLEDKNAALESIRAANKLKSGDPEMMYFEAELLTSLGKDKEAAAMAEKILEIQPGHAHALIILADFNRMTESYERALELYHEASKTLATKAYAEHYIDVIEHILEEREIEREYEERLKQEKASQNNQ